jgi:hypothetical protein
MKQTPSEFSAIFSEDIRVLSLISNMIQHLLRGEKSMNLQKMNQDLQHNFSWQDYVNFTYTKELQQANEMTEASIQQVKKYMEEWKNQPFVHKQSVYGVRWSVQVQAIQQKYKTLQENYQIYLEQYLQEIPSLNTMQLVELVESSEVAFQNMQEIEQLLDNVLQEFTRNPMNIRSANIQVKPDDYFFNVFSDINTAIEKMCMKPSSQPSEYIPLQMTQVPNYDCDDYTQTEFTTALLDLLPQDYTLDRKIFIHTHTQLAQCVQQFGYLKQNVAESFSFLYCDKY